MLSNQMSRYKSKCIRIICILFQRPTPVFASNVVSVILWMPDDWLLLSDINHMISKKTSEWQLPGNKRRQTDKGSPSLQMQSDQLKSDIKLWTAFLAVEVKFTQKFSVEQILKRGFIKRLSTRAILNVLNFLNIYNLN